MGAKLADLYLRLSVYNGGGAGVVVLTITRVSDVFWRGILPRLHERFLQGF